MSSAHKNAALDARVQFAQPGPRLGNPWLEDAALRRFTGVMLGGAVPAAVDQDLSRFGDKCCGAYVEMADNAERFKPELEQFDQWGRRVDRLHLSEGWKFFKRESAVEGLVAIPYESREANARVHQAVKLLLFAPSSGMFSCPLAMTDGAALALNGMLAEQQQQASQQKSGEPRRSGTGELSSATAAELREAVGHLTTRDPDHFWTSGQWFTEKMGGSDLSRATQTFAEERPTVFGTHALSGYKWFTSAVDSEMTLTLAALADPADGPGDMHLERKSLSLFYLRTHVHEQQLSEEERADLRPGELPLNGIRVARLKSKMATRQLPTAELVLDGSAAHLLSAPGAGIKCVTPMLTITRLHNALSAAGYMLRMRSLAVDFAHTRSAFGTPIVDKPLHVQSLFAYDMDARGNLLMSLELARLLGRVETGAASREEDGVMRVLTSLVKVMTARDGVRLMSEGVELFGAVGVMDNHMSTLFRDSAVLPIWEGTTNTLSLDLVRVAAREPEALAALHATLLAMAPAEPRGGASADTFRASVDALFAYIRENAAHLDRFEWNARRLTMNLSRLVVCGLAARTAAQTGHAEDHALFEHWLRRVQREHEPMEDPEDFKHMRAALPREANGDKLDARGRPRAML